MTNRTIPCPECSGNNLKCAICDDMGMVVDRRSPTAAERAVERVVEWLNGASRPYAPQVVQDAEKYVRDRVLEIIREEEGR